MAREHSVHGLATPKTRQQTAPQTLSFRKWLVKTEAMSTNCKNHSGKWDTDTREEKKSVTTLESNSVKSRNFHTKDAGSLIHLMHTDRHTQG